MCGGSDRFRFDDKKGAGRGSAISAARVTGLSWRKSVWRDPVRSRREGERRDRNLSPVAPEVMAAAEAETDAAAKRRPRWPSDCWRKRARPPQRLPHPQGVPRPGMSGTDSQHKTGGVTFRAGDVVVPLYEVPAHWLTFSLLMLTVSNAP